VCVDVTTIGGFEYTDIKADSNWQDSDEDEELDDLDHDADEFDDENDAYHGMDKVDLEVVLHMKRHDIVSAEVESSSAKSVLC